MEAAQKIKDAITCQASWGIPVTLVFERWRQNGYQFGANLGYAGSSKPATL
jgi:hypothetical protein